MSLKKSLIPFNKNYINLFIMLSDLRSWLNFFHFCWIWFHAQITKSRLLFILPKQGTWQTKCTDPVLLLATICLGWLGKGQRRKHWLCTIICKLAAITAAQFSMCKISAIPLRTYSEILNYDTLSPQECQNVTLM